MNRRLVAGGTLALAASPILITIADFIMYMPVAIVFGIAGFLGFLGGALSLVVGVIRWRYAANDRRALEEARVPKARLLT